MKAMLKTALNAGAKFQGVVASEVIEHVPDPEGFCRSLAALSRVTGHSDGGSQGMVIISTLNRTPRSYAVAVLAAERLLRLLPVGTHDWDKFITPGMQESLLPCRVFLDQLLSVIPGWKHLFIFRALKSTGYTGLLAS